MMTFRFKPLIFVLLGTALVACTPVKVQQGNLLPQSKLDRLHIGMNKQEVAQVMGTSLLSTPFTDSHWDYAYTRKINDKTIVSKHVVLDFEGNTLTTISTQ